MQTSQDTTASSPYHKVSTNQSRLLEVTRDFKVPVDRLFSAFTAEALRIWWWPKNLHADYIDYDFRGGGHYFINMKGIENGSGGMTGDFEEIVRDKRIVMTDQFADKNGQPVSAREAGMPGDWPRLIYITFDFEAIDDNASRLILSQQGIPNEMQKDCIQRWLSAHCRKQTSGRLWNDFRPIVEATMAGQAQHFVDLPIALAGRPERPGGYFTFPIRRCTTMTGQ